MENFFTSNGLWETFPITKPATTTSTVLMVNPLFNQDLPNPDNFVNQDLPNPDNFVNQDLPNPDNFVYQDLPNPDNFVYQDLPNPDSFVVQITNNPTTSGNPTTIGYPTTSNPNTGNPTTGNPTTTGNPNIGNPDISNIYNYNSNISDIYNTYISNINHIYINNNNISNIHNIHSNVTLLSHADHIDFNSPAIDVAQLVIIGLGLLVTLLAIFAVFSLVKKDHAAPVFVINLLISDLVQLCSTIPQFVQKSDKISAYIYLIGVMASVGFMVCVSMERYLVIAWPLWYRFRRNLKTSLVICVIVWAVSIIFIPTLYLNADFSITSTIMGVFLLLPFPLFIFFLVGTLRALSEAISVPADEKRRIVAILVLVLLIYTLLFLPPIIGLLVKEALNNDAFVVVVSNCVFISPLADSTMYILMKKSVLDQVFASLCCCKIFKNQQTESVDNDRLQIVDAAVSSPESV